MDVHQDVQRILIDLLPSSLNLAPMRIPAARQCRSGRCVDGGAQIYDAPEWPLEWHLGSLGGSGSSDAASLKTNIRPKNQAPNSVFFRFPATKPRNIMEHLQISTSLSRTHTNLDHLLLHVFFSRYLRYPKLSSAQPRLFSPGGRAESSRTSAGGHAGEVRVGALENPSKRPVGEAVEIVPWVGILMWIYVV